MKQAATILLMVILAFNWAGFRLLSGYLEHRSDIALEAQINSETYDENRLLELRVPLNAPYLSANTEFERIDGEIEIEGIHYRYVKRKVENGDLVLMCIPHDGKTRILNSRTDFVKMVNDVNQTNDGKNKNTASFKSFTTEYKQETNCWNIQSLNLPFSETRSSTTAFTNDGFDAIPEQPPKA